MKFKLVCYLLFFMGTFTVLSGTAFAQIARWYGGGDFVGEQIGVDYVLNDGVIFKMSGGRSVTVHINGRTLAFDKNRLGVFYVKYAEDMPGGLYAGFFPHETAEESRERRSVVSPIERGEAATRLVPFVARLPEADDNSVKNFFVWQDAAYILFSGGRLVRVSMNTGKIKAIEDVLAACMCGDVPVIAKRSGQGIVVVCNGREVPCGLAAYNNASLTNIANRLALVTSGRDMELIDVLALTNVSRIPAEAVAVEPEEYNLLITVEDSEIQRASEQERLGFYKIFINGIEEGRTETGLTVVPKEFTLSLKEDKYYLVFAERWELNRKKNEYVRANNVYQPEPIKLYVPANRIMRLRYTFTGRDYNIVSDVVTSP